jgi:hypothetical protein
MLVTDTEPKRLALLPRQRQNYVGGGSSGLSAGASGRGFAVRPLLRGFSTADAWWELFFANACSSLSAFCLLTSFSTARTQVLDDGRDFVPVNSSRRSISLHTRMCGAQILAAWRPQEPPLSKSSQRCTASTASLTTPSQSDALREMIKLVLDRTSKDKQFSGGVPI